MYKVKFGLDHVSETDRLNTAVRMAHALAEAGFGVHVIDPDGRSLNWRNIPYPYKA